MIEFVSDLRGVGGFFRVLWFPPPKKNDRREITEILLKVALNSTTITLTRFIIKFMLLVQKDQLLFHFCIPLDFKLLKVTEAENISKTVSNILGIYYYSVTIFNILL